MYSLYRRLGATEPVLLHVDEDLQSIKNYLIGLLEKDRLTREQAIALIEIGIPIKWTNGQYITRMRKESSVYFESEDGQLTYIIMIGE